jgi:hypothetical protein
MSEAYLQILMILVYLSIGLLAVIFPIYAIAVNYFPQEKWEGEKQRKKTIETLRNNIKKLTKDFEEQDGDSRKAQELKKEIEKYNVQLKTQEPRSMHLGVEGAVAIPTASLIFSLIITGIGIYSYYEWSASFVEPNDISMAVFILGPSFFIGVSLFAMYKTVSSVQLAALVTEKSIDYIVGFTHDLKSKIEIELGKKYRIHIMAMTKDFDVENRVLLVKIPKSLAVNKDANDVIFGADNENDYLECSDVYVPKGIKAGVSPTIQPIKAGEYPIKVVICGKGFARYETDLIISVKQPENTIT